MTIKTARSNARPHTAVVLSDIDGTIVRGSLVLEHARYLHNEKIIDLGDLPERWVADRKDEVAIAALAAAYREAIVGKSYEDIHTLDFVKNYASDDSNFYSTIHELVEAKKNGYKVILISGSPSYLVTPFARKFGFMSKGSNYKRDKTGLLTGECVGMYNADSKRRHVASLKVQNYSHVVAYGDTMSDVPLFEVADYSVIVAPSPTTMKSVEPIIHKVIDD